MRTEKKITNKKIAILMILLTLTQNCKQKNNTENINITELRKSMSIIYSFSNALIFTSYTFIKIYELLDICAIYENEKTNINCVFDFRQLKEAKTQGKCEKKSGKNFPIRLENCEIVLSAQNFYLELYGTVELSKFKVYYENLTAKIITPESYSGSIDISETFSEIFLIEYETIRYFKINATGNIGRNSIRASNYVVRDDGFNPIQIQFENSHIETNGCAKLNIEITSENFISFSKNSCPQNGIVLKDNKKITFLGGEIQYEDKVERCPEIPECPVVYF
ncbi:MAG: hypothetical protein RMJ45_03635 [Candidatus Calescibacterium sp.]|nr:hypothetical protein [Candidatus Calescibacterium sp.]